ncbi:Hypothetical protein D9617_1g080480 [Elsinoe fawcettii]|nr:Hypothetical protein D9617_1g080480 [Elsinoe fawcettii]
MNQSPKRKRQAPLTSTSSADPAESTPPATDSPRTQVASRFQNLEIQETPLQFRMNVDTSDSDHSGSPRKRQRRTSHLSTSSTPTPEKTLQLRPKAAHTSNRPRQTSQPELPSSPPISPSQAMQPSPLPFDPTELPSTPSRTPKPSPSKIPPAAHAAPVSPVGLSAVLSTATTNGTKATTPQKSKKRLSPPSQAQGLDSSSPAQMAFWQPKEITGHIIDTSTPDDSDGLGINGIGFQPTAAGLEVRRAKRRQQISEWRAREAKEDRRKRFEKRRGGDRRAGSGSGDSVEVQGLGLEEGRRGVRFVDVGGE